MLTLLFLLILNGDQVERLNAGGRLSKVQQAMDIRKVHLALDVTPAEKTIAGYARLTLHMQETFDTLELDLVDSLIVSQVLIDDRNVAFLHQNHKLSINWPEPRSNSPTITVHYAGHPWEATDPPWEGGFNWSRTDSGQPWVGVSCQSYGAKVWFPSKNHPADKIQGLTMAITVAENLYCAANGLLERIESGDHGRRTFYWASRYPIAAYNVSINIAEYDVMERTYQGEKDMPVVFYVLREYQQADQLPGDERSYAAKKAHILDESLRYLAFFAKHFGEYPFIEEKFGIAHTAYYGMEHQTINSYGNNFRRNDGYDFLLFHEMAHEWWGNKITINDWAHYWIHEGIGTYTSGMYLEEIGGEAAMLQFFEETRRAVSNKQALVPKHNATTGESYTLDVYNKGALVIHALRYLLGKDQLYRVLYAVANNDRFSYQQNIDTDAFIQVAEKVANQPLRWFFERYLYRAAPPILTVREDGGNLCLTWDETSFRMPVEVVFQHEGETRTQRIVMDEGQAQLPIPAGATYQVDPHHWVYKTVRHPD